MPQFERRERLGATLVRARDTDAGPIFEGRPIAFDERTLIGALPWGYYEEIAPGSVDATLAAGADVAFLVNHDTTLVVSRTSAGTLTLRSDASGVVAEAPLNVRKSYVADLAENLRDGSVRGMSFGFYVTSDEWTTVRVAVTPEGDPIEADLRRITGLELVEVSTVTFPQYTVTEASVRELRDARRLVQRDRLVGPAPRGDRLALRDVSRAMAARFGLDYQTGDGMGPGAATGSEGV